MSEKRKFQEDKKEDILTLDNLVLNFESEPRTEKALRNFADEIFSKKITSSKIEIFFLSQDVTSYLNCHSYWLLHLIGLLSFSKYILSINEPRTISLFIRTSFLDFKSGVEIDKLLSSLAADMSLYIFNSAFGSNIPGRTPESASSQDLDMFHNKCQSILDEIMNYSHHLTNSTVREDPKIINYSDLSLLAELALIFFVSPENKSLTNWLKKHIYFMLNCLINIPEKSDDAYNELIQSVNIIHNVLGLDKLQGYITEELFVSTVSIFDSLHRDKFLRVASLCSKPVYDLLLTYQANDISISDAINPILNLSFEAGCKQKNQTILIRCFNLAISVLHSTLFQGWLEKSLEILDSDIIGFVFLSCCEIVNNLFIDKLKILISSVRKKRNLNRESADIFTEVARVRLRVLEGICNIDITTTHSSSSSNSIVPGSLLDIPPPEINDIFKPERIYSWCNTIKQTNILPASLTQIFQKFGHSKGRDLIFMRLNLLYIADPNIKPHCIEIVKAIYSNSLCNQEELENFIFILSASPTSSMQACIEQLDISPESLPALSEALRFLSSIADRIVMSKSNSLVLSPDLVFQLSFKWKEICEKIKYDNMHNPSYDIGKVSSVLVSMLIQLSQVIYEKVLEKTITQFENDFLNLLSLIDRLISLFLSGSNDICTKVFFSGIFEACFVSDGMMYLYNGGVLLITFLDQQIWELSKFFILNEVCGVKTASSSFCWSKTKQASKIPEKNTLMQISSSSSSSNINQVLYDALLFNQKLSEMIPLGNKYTSRLYENRCTLILVMYSTSNHYYSELSSSSSSSSSTTTTTWPINYLQMVSLECQEAFEGIFHSMGFDDKLKALINLFDSKYWESCIDLICNHSCLCYSNGCSMLNLLRFLMIRLDKTTTEVVGKTYSNSFDLTSVFWDKIVKISIQIKESYHEIQKYLNFSKDFLLSITSIISIKQLRQAGAVEFILTKGTAVIVDPTKSFAYKTIIYLLLTELNAIVGSSYNVNHFSNDDLTHHPKNICGCWFTGLSYLFDISSFLYRKVQLNISDIDARISHFGLLNIRVSPIVCSILFNVNSSDVSLEILTNINFFDSKLYLICKKKLFPNFFQSNLSINAEQSILIVKCMAWTYIKALVHLSKAPLMKIDYHKELTNQLAQETNQNYKKSFCTSLLSSCLLLTSFFEIKSKHQLANLIRQIINICLDILFLDSTIRDLAILIFNEINSHFPLVFVIKCLKQFYVTLSNEDNKYGCSDQILEFKRLVDSPFEFVNQYKNLLDDSEVSNIFLYKHEVIPFV